MKYFKTFLFSLLVVVGVSVAQGVKADAPTYSPGDVVINEFLITPSTGSEWYELLNATGGDIDLSGWTLNRASTSDSISLSGTLPAYGILVFSTTSSPLNNEGDLLTLNDGTSSTINAISYGTVTTDPELLIPHMNAPGVDESGYISDPMFPGDYSVAISPSKGWFNNAGGLPPIPPTLLFVDSQLGEPGVDILSNIGELENPSATPATEGAGALYFEKTLEDGMGGKIVFEQSLNLTDSETVAVLQNLGNAMEITNGHIKFDSTTASAMTATGAKIYLYGFPYATTPDIIIRDDDGNILGTNDPSLVGSITYDAGTLSFSALHFTQFDVPDNAAISADSEALTPDTILGVNVDLLNITEALSFLPISGSASSSDISWVSSDENIVSSDGQNVNRPIFSSGDASITLTATITKGLASTTKAFNLTVLKQDASSDTTISSEIYSVVTGELGTIGNVTYGTSTSNFLSALTKGEVHQTWDSSNITDPVTEGNTLVVTAEDGATTFTYTVSSLIPNIPVNLLMTPSSPTNNTQPTFSWDAVVNDPVITYYEVEMYDSDGNFIDSSTTPEVSFTTDSTLSDYDYVWNVRACTEGAVCSVWSSDQSFTIDTESPTVTGLGDGTNDYQLSSTCPSIACDRGDIYGDRINFSETLSSSAKTAVENAITAGASVAPRAFMWNGGTLRIYTTEETSFAEDVIVNITDLAGNTASDLLLIDSENPVQTIFTSISSGLSSSENAIVNNLNTVTSLNYTNFSGLYFEKRTDVYDPTTAVGKITFNSALDLSSSDTQTFLQNLGSEIDVSNPGVIGLNLSDATAAGFVNKSATIKFYGLNNLGFSAESTAEEINSKMIAFDDSSNLIGTSTLISEPGTYLGACEVGGGCYVFTLGVNHFTTYKIDTTAPIGSITNVEADANLYGTTTINADASDSGGSGVSRVEFWFYSDGTEIGEDTTTPYSINWNTRNVSDGSHSVLLKIYDNAGNLYTTDSIAVTIDNTAPTVTKWGNNTEDMTINTSDTADMTFSEPLSSASKTAVQNALTAGADRMITYRWSEDNSVLTVTGNASGVTTFDNDVVISSVTDLFGNTSSSLLLVDSVLSSTQTSPSDGTAEINNTTSEVVITDPMEEVEITITSDATEPKIDLSSFITEGTGIIPRITITAENAGNATIAIPATTTVTSADTSWDGVIAAPTITTVTLPDTSGVTKTLTTAIEVGFSGAKLSFDKAVRILFPSQAGKKVGYVRTGTTFTEISATCSSDSQTAGDALATDGDCKIDVGSDLVIWTKHFTSFATYTQTTNTTTTNYGGGGIAGSGPASLGYVKTYPAVAVVPVPSSSMSTKEIQAEILRLTDLLNTLRALAGGGANNITTNLAFGSKGAEVTNLQKILNSDPDTRIASVGAGSPGNETTFFGTATRSAVIKFQIKHGISPAAGFVGRLTRAKLSAMMIK